MVQVIEQQGLGDILGQGLGTGLSQGIGTALNEMLEQKKINTLERELHSRGLPKPLARLGAVATRGGQTEIVKYALDQFKRDMDPNFQNLQQQQMMGQFPGQEAEQNLTEQRPQIGSPDIGLTPSERIGREKERYKSNLPIYQEATTKIKDTDKTRDLVGILENIDKTGKLPKNLGRVNVDKEGNLRFPFASTPEAERFVKTLNEFSVGAKETFGSRVTNFDLAQFMKRFPTLLNSAEGRKQIYQQMKIINDINKVYYSSLKKAYNSAGGVRKIDADEAERIADILSEKKIQELKNKYAEIGTFTTKGNPAEFKGRKIRNPKTGEIEESDGKRWIPVRE